MTPVTFLKEGVIYSGLLCMCSLRRALYIVGKTQLQYCTYSIHQVAVPSASYTS